MNLTSEQKVAILELSNKYKNLAISCCQDDISDTKWRELFTEVNKEKRATDNEDDKFELSIILAIVLIRLI